MDDLALPHDAPDSACVWGASAGPEVSRRASALVFADDIGIFLAIARSLGRIGVQVDIATSIADHPGFSSKFIRHIHRLPPYLSQTEEWVSQVRRLCTDYEYRLVIPTCDSLLALLDRFAEHLGPSRLALPNQQALITFTDKAKCRALANDLGIDVAAGALIYGVSDVPMIEETFGFPMVCKPRRSYSQGDVDDKQFAQIVNDRQTLEHIISNASPASLIAEAYFDGDGVGISVLAERGAIKLAWQHRRLQAVSATGRSSVRRGEQVDEKMFHDVVRLSKAVELDGVAMFEFRQNRSSGRHILIEVNPRFWGSLPLAVAAGADFPAQLWRQYTGKPPVKTEIHTGTTKRDLRAEYDRIAGALGDRRGWLKRLSLALDVALLVRHLLWPRSCDSWSADDPKPATKERAAIRDRMVRFVLRR